MFRGWNGVMIAYIMSLSVVVRCCPYGVPGRPYLRDRTRSALPPQINTRSFRARCVLIRLKLMQVCFEGGVQL